MESSDNERVVREIYEAFGRGDVGEVLARMKDDARWDVNVGPSEVPWHTPAMGPAGDPEVPGQVHGERDPAGLRAGPVHRLGDDVVVDVHLAYTVKRTGKLVDEEQLHGGRSPTRRVTRLRRFEDTAQVVSAWRGGAG